MRKFKVLIVDDEPRAHKVLENYIARMPDLMLVGNFLNAITAEAFLKENKVDLILLDITMPEIDGFGLLTQLDNPPMTIFTTAHSEFALKSYEYNAVDYLKKPISFERFRKAIKKVQYWIQHGLDMGPEPESVQLRVEGRDLVIPFNQILYFESIGNYVKIYTEGKMLVSKITTKELETKLPQSIFIRIQKSFIVNIRKIESYSDEEIVLGKEKLQIGKTFKKYTHEILSKMLS